MAVPSGRYSKTDFIGSLANRDSNTSKPRTIAPRSTGSSKWSTRSFATSSFVWSFDVTVHFFATRILLQCRDDFREGPSGFAGPSTGLFWAQELRRRLFGDRGQRRHLEMANLSRGLVDRTDRAPEHDLFRGPLKPGERIEEKFSLGATARE